MSMPDELRDLLAISLVSGIGPHVYRSLREHFGSASVIRHATMEQFQEVPRIGEWTARKFVSALREMDVQKEIDLMEAKGVHLVAADTIDYPPSLSTISDPPIVLYVQGSLLPADQKAVAIVGSRKCTTYGKRFTEHIAAGLAKAGYTVVSGLARGIDGVAHKAALNAGGRTLAVLAGGLQSIYPPEHFDLADQVVRQGALISERPMLFEPRKELFHTRNRIISGLAQAVVVIEANDKSGALITANHAAEQSRDVFVLPANVDNVYSAGSLQLLRDGARLIRNIDDLLEDLQGLAPLGLPPATQSPSTKQEAKPVLASIPTFTDPIQQQVWEFLSESRQVDEITQQLNRSSPEVIKILMAMEMKKQIRRLPGNRFERL